MASFLGNIPGSIMGAGRGFVNTVTLGAEKFSKSTLWQRTGGVAIPFFRDTADAVYPTALRFRVFSKETAGGFLMAVGTGAALNGAQRLNNHYHWI